MLAHRLRRYPNTEPTLNQRIIKDSADILAGSITKIMYLSLTEGKFPDAVKIAHVTPVLQNPSLD